MEKRGQVQQLFVYIFAMIVGAMIIGFGYYAITNIWKLFDEVNTIKFKQDFQKQIGAYYTYAPNTNGNIQLTTPSGIKAICFISEGDISKISYKDINVVNGKNVYFSTIKEGASAKPFYADKFRPNPDPLCINISKGILDIDLMTTGNYVVVSEHK